MKIKCTCGNLIYDGTDQLPHKGHIIPDKNFFDIPEAIDEILDKVKENKSVEPEDYMQHREALFGKTKLIYQCSSCGSLLVWDKKKQDYYIFKPENLDTPKDILKEN